MNASHSSSGSGSSVGDNVADVPTPVTKTVSSNTADSCTWYADSSCKPRTCYDCLNVKVASGECAIMPNGMCVNLDEYAKFLSTQEEFGIYYKYYPSSEHKYCSADDAACSACKSTWIADYKSAGTIETPAQCTGLDGCLCLARCELPDWSSSIVADQCSSSGSIGTSGSRTSTASRIGFALAIGVAMGVLLGLWGIKLLLRGRGNGRGHGSYVPAIRETWAVPRRSPKGPQLELTAWKELREKLIAVEQEVFGVRTEASRVESQTDSAVASTPDALEEGGGYRAMSPSQTARQPSDAPRLQS